MIVDKRILDNLVFKDESYWNSIIAGYIKCGEINQAFSVCDEMRENGIYPTVYTCVTLLQNCTRQKDLKRGQLIHMDLSNRDLIRSNAFIGSTLINMYSKCGFFSKAEEVFDQFIVKSIVLWNALISGYAEHGHSMKTFQCLNQMRSEGVFPDAITQVYSLRACSSIGSVVKGEEIYVEIISKGFLETDLFIRNSLVDLYAKCGFLEKAEELLCHIPHRDIVSWNALISGYAEYGYAEKALDCLERMQDDGISSDVVTLVCILKACGSMRNFLKGERIHGDIMRKGFFETDAYIGSSLVHMYAQCGLLTEAHCIFRILPFKDVVTWNGLIAGYAGNGYGEEALYCIPRMEAEGILPDSYTFIYSLKACCSMGVCQVIHSCVVKKGLDRDLFLGNTLIDVYAKCGLLAEAQTMFNNLPTHFVAAWNALIGGYAEHGHAEEALSCIENLLIEGTRWDVITAVNSLKACGIVRSINKGQIIHSLVTKSGFLERDSFIGSNLVDMYGKCESLLEAQYMFKNLVVQDEVSWTILFAQFLDHGNMDDIIVYYKRMEQEGIFPDAITTSCILKACGSLENIAEGRDLHAKIVQLGILETEDFVGSNLVDMYVKCGCLMDAEDVFNKLLSRDELSWTAIIRGYSEQGTAEDIGSCLQQMKLEGIPPDSQALIFCLKSCNVVGNIENGNQIHSEIIKRGMERELAIRSTLIDMYSKYGFLDEAQEVFDEIADQDVPSWDAIIGACAECGNTTQALKYFEKMQLDGVSPSCTTFANILKVCANMGTIQSGYQVHSEIVKNGFEMWTHIGNLLLDTYVKCGSLRDAQNVFHKFPERTIISWNTLISGYVDLANGQEAINCSLKMNHDGLTPDSVTLTCCLKACGTIRSIEKGQDIHIQTTKKGLETEFSVGNTLIDMYVKCGFLRTAQSTFEKLPIWDVVPWTAIVSGYIEYGCSEEALDHFEEMQCKGIAISIVTFVCILKACGIIGASEKGRGIYLEIVKKGFDEELIVGNSLLDMYCKCGLLVDAQQVFDQAEVQDVISWNTLLTGYSQLGQGKDVFDTFSRMAFQGTTPNLITFTSILNLCSHEGLLDCSKVYFDSMTNIYNLIPVPEHFTCIIDLLGRAGHIQKALEMVIQMPFHPTSVIWHSILGACQKWGDLECGRHAFEYAILQDVKDTAAYISMSNILCATL